MANWVKISARVNPIPVDWSLFADAFHRHGCPGKIIEDEMISGYLTDLPGAEPITISLRKDLTRLGANQVTVEIVPDHDWSELWKIHFKPRRIGKRFVICPSWEVSFASEPGDIVITLDPGQAFGTGDHPTTRLCLRLLEAVDAQGMTVADVGCGSGVLAIAAALVGASEVVASDLDPLSVEITGENMIRNGVTFATAVAPGFDAAPNRQFDLVLSNIISATLIRLAPDAAAHVKSGGYWIVSGIIEANWPDVQQAAEFCGFKLKLMENEDEWVGAIFSC